MKEKAALQELIHELHELTSRWRLVTALVFTENDWKEQHKKYNNILSEIKKLAKARVEDIVEEQTALNKAYPKFWKKMFWKPKKIQKLDRKLHNLQVEINQLTKYLERKFYD